MTTLAFGRQQLYTGFRWVCHCVIVATMVLIIGPQAADKPTLDRSKIVSALSARYGERAGLRANAWFNILDKSQQLDDMGKLNAVNSFFNLFRFVDDIKLWGDSNYWATPLEFIGANGGDCEDFSIAKYFTLLQLGIPDEKMRITMVKATSVNQYHMVLAYYDKPSSIPLILDNLDPVLKPATKRGDLIPVYSFNGKQLWLNKERGRGELAGSSSRLEKWNDLKYRLGADRLRKPKMVLE